MYKCKKCGCTFFRKDKDGDFFCFMCGKYPDLPRNIIETKKNEKIKAKNEKEYRELLYSYQVTANNLYSMGYNIEEIKEKLNIDEKYIISALKRFKGKFVKTKKQIEGEKFYE